MMLSAYVVRQRTGVDCGVASLATTLGVSYATVARACSARVRRYGLAPTDTRRACKRLGYTLAECLPLAGHGVCVVESDTRDGPAWRHWLAWRVDDDGDVYVTCPASGETCHVLLLAWQRRHVVEWYSVDG